MASKVKRKKDKQDMAFYRLLNENADFKKQIKKLTAVVDKWEAIIDSDSAKGVGTIGYSMKVLNEIVTDIKQGLKKI